MLTEQEIIDHITLDEQGRLMVRKTTVILKDGVEISRAHHRWSLDPDAEPDASFPLDVVESRIAKARIDIEKQKDKRSARERGRTLG
jgi:hypothetical protein